MDNASIYEPHEDSFLLAECLKEFLLSLKSVDKNSFKILDMGSGSGIQAEVCRELGFRNILVSDINLSALKLLKSKGFRTIESDLFSNITERFDLIIFNPPYLPLDEREPSDNRSNTTGGKEGYEIIIEFLRQAKSHLNNDGKIIFLFSSLSSPETIRENALKEGYDLHILKTKKLFFEELYVCVVQQ